MLEFLGNNLLYKTTGVGATAVIVTSVRNYVEFKILLFISRANIHDVTISGS